MNVSIDQRVLAAALHDVYRAVHANSPVPLLTGIKLDAHEQGVTLTGSQTSLTIQASIDESGCQVAQTGNVVLPAKALFETVRRLSPGTLVIAKEPNLRVTARSQSTVFRLSGMDAALFPAVETSDPDAFAFTLNIADFAKAISRVVFAASLDENRPQLTGVSFRFVDSEHLTMTATNGVRLASHTVPVSAPGRNSGNRSAIVPGPYVRCLAQLAAAHSECCSMTLTDRHLTASTGARIMQTALIAGSYPLSAAFPSASFRAEMALDAQQLADALERATLLAGSTKNVRLFSGERNSLRLFARSGELGDIDEDLPVRRAAGERFSVHCNGVYLKEIVRAAQCETVTLRIGGPLEPIRVLPVDDPACFYLLSPIRTNETA